MLKGKINFDSPLSRVIIASVIIVVVAAGWFWWRNIQTSSNNVFWGMISNNLATSSVTRHLNQEVEDRSLEQYIRLQFGAVNAAESRVTLKQSSSGGESVVKSNTIGTPEVDYSRYVSIDTPEKDADGKPIDTSKVIGIWGKTDKAKQGQPQTAEYFKQGILTIVPYAYFNQEQRQQLIDLMRDKSVYKFDNKDVKSMSKNGRPAYVYTVSVNPAHYVEMMRTYVQELGLGNIGLDPSVYAGVPDLKVEMTIDKISRQLLEINYPDSQQSEAFVDQNLDQPVHIPDATITINELQDRVQKIVQ